MDCSISVAAGLGSEYVGKIPAQCTQLLVFDAAGEFVDGLSYGIAQNLKHEGPVAFAPGDALGAE